MPSPNQLTAIPILFREQMIRALLSGRKTQTRRLSSLAEEGDFMWVRERCHMEGEKVAYWADMTTDERLKIAGWCASIHMPRKASRLTLKVKATRMERLQKISPADAQAEGFNSVKAFGSLWRELHGAANWDFNPEVVVIEFDVIHANIDDWLKSGALQ